MAITTMYHTSDGREFTSLETAQQYEAALEVLDTLRAAILSAGANEKQAKQLAKNLLKNPNLLITKVE